MSDKKPSVKGKRSPRWAFMERMVIPCESGEQYLVRLRLIQTPLFGIYLHDLNAPDADKDPHNHPWDFVSFILSGAYTEDVYPTPWEDIFESRYKSYKRTWRQLSWHKMNRNAAHRIVSVEPGTRSLIFVGRRSQQWGFFTKDGWAHWEFYEKQKGIIS